MRVCDWMLGEQSARTTTTTTGNLPVAGCSRPHSARRRRGEALAGPTGAAGWCRASGWPVRSDVCPTSARARGGETR